MKMLPTTRQAVQATVAVAAVSVLAFRFPQLERTYWATITALVVLCQTWSESMKKAAQRVAATFLGLGAAVLLHEILRPWPPAQVAVIFLCVFLFAYSVSGSYLWAIFWTSILVVLMFDLLGVMGNRLVLARMYETLIGAGVAVLVSALVLPVRIREQLKSDVPAFMAELRTSYYRTLSRAAGVAAEGQPPPPQPEILSRFQQLRNDHRTRRTETFLLRREPSRAHRWVLWMELLVFYDSDMRQAVDQGHDERLAARIQEELLLLRDRIAQALDQVVDALTHGHPVEVPPIADLFDSIRDKLHPLLTQGVEQRRACVGFFPILYYVRKIHGVLENMAAELNARTR